MNNRLNELLNQLLLTKLSYGGACELADLIRKEIKRLEKWVADLQSDKYINCVYCGHRYGPIEETEQTQQEILYAHIQQCPEHPLSKAQKRIDELLQNGGISMDNYQKQAIKTATYPSILTTVLTILKDIGVDVELPYVENSPKLQSIMGNPYYVALGMAGEVGEVANKLKKMFRDNGGQITSEMRSKIGNKMGDVLWYVAVLCTELNISMQSVALNNLQKLESRAQRGTQ